MATQDIRWHQRFSNYNRALNKLAEVVAGIDADSTEDDIFESLSDLEKEGLIQRFEYTHELAWTWNVMKDYVEYQGATDIGGSRDATREAFKIGLIVNGAVWMDMIKSRNLTTHTYNKDTAEDIFLKIVREYFSEFEAFGTKMEELRNGSQHDIFSEEV